MQDLEVVIPDPAKVYTAGMVEAKPVTTSSPSQQQESHKGLFVDRGVGSPRVVKSASVETFAADVKHGSENKVFATFLQMKLCEVLFFS